MNLFRKNKPTEETPAPSPAELDMLKKAFQAEDERAMAEDQAWWDSLSTEERARAFRKVAGMIYQSEVKERGSYRHAMYDVFEIDYSDGLLCHYMELHNLIHQGLQAQDCK